MIVQELSLPVKQIRIDTYNFYLMLVLVITQIETLVVFVCNLRLYITPVAIVKSRGTEQASKNIFTLLGLLANKLGFWRF